MLKMISGVLAFAAMLIATTVWAQPSATVAKCRADNQRAHSEVMQMFNQAKAQGNISPGDKKAFSDTESRLNNHAQMLKKSGLTLAECQKIGREIAAERTNVQQLAASPYQQQQIIRCRAENQRAYSEVVKMLNSAKSQRGLTRTDARAFSEMERRLDNYIQTMNRGAMKLSVCQQIGREIAGERAALQRMAPGR